MRLPLLSLLLAASFCTVQTLESPPKKAEPSSVQIQAVEKGLAVINLAVQTETFSFQLAGIPASETSVQCVAYNGPTQSQPILNGSARFDFTMPISAWGYAARCITKPSGYWYQRAILTSGSPILVTEGSQPSRRRAIRH